MIDNKPAVLEIMHPIDVVVPGNDPVVDIPSINIGIEDANYTINGDQVLQDKVLENINKAELSRESEYAQCATEMGVSVDDLKRTLQARVEMIVANSQLFIAANPDTLGDILNGSGRFKSQFETNTTGGWGTPRYRAYLEMQMFGFNADIESNAVDADDINVSDEVVTENVTKRPIYGYFSDHPNGVVNSEGKIPPESDFTKYGRVTIQFKDDVKRRTTISFGDTIDYYEKGMVPSPALAPHFTSFPFPKYIPYAPHYINSLVASSKSNWGATPEAQFHGSLTVDDIESIHVSTANGLTAIEIAN